MLFDVVFFNQLYKHLCVEAHNYSIDASDRGAQKSTSSYYTIVFTNLVTW